MMAHLHANWFFGFYRRYCRHWGPSVSLISRPDATPRNHRLIFANTFLCLRAALVHESKSK